MAQRLSLHGLTFISVAVYYHILPWSKMCFWDRSKPLRSSSYGAPAITGFLSLGIQRLTVLGKVFFVPGSEHPLGNFSSAAGNFLWVPYLPHHCKGLCKLGEEGSFQHHRTFASPASVLGAPWGLSSPASVFPAQQPGWLSALQKASSRITVDLFSLRRLPSQHCIHENQPPM